MIIMSGDKNKEMMNCRIALQRHYVSLSHSQAIRIIGFVAGLLTLIQIVQISAKGQLSSLYPIKIILFLIPVLILLFYIFRAFFKFALFSAYSAHVLCIENTEIEYLIEKEEHLKGKNLMILLDSATSRKISGDLKKNDKENYRRSSLYKIFYYDWFMAKNVFTGILLCCVLSLLSIFILLAILW